MSTEDGRQPMLMVTTMNQLGWIRDAHGSVELSYGPGGWLAMVCDRGGEPITSSKAHLDLGESVQELYIALGEPG